LSSKTPRVLLIDGDVWVYRAAAASEYATKWDDDVWTLHAHENEAQVHLDQQINGLMDALDADRAIFALSSSVVPNFRYDVLPTYKSNRVEKRKPMLIGPLKNYLRNNYEIFERPGLEGDDVLGILSTSPKIVKGEKIIVSVDKDLKTIPGKLLNLHDTEQLIDGGEIDDIAEGIVEITTAEADFNHMVQTLSGDATDGYGGCPGIGEKTAHNILAEPTRLVRVERPVKSGKNKGQYKVQWEKGEPCSMWQAVVDRFVWAGLAEADALQQARVARILRREDYDFENAKPLPWTPENCGTV